MPWYWVHLVLCSIAVGASVNNRPIVGILAQQYDSTNESVTFIAASYVKFVESAGARAVPIRVDQSVDYYTNIFNAVNGILLPGGDVDPYNSSYTRAARILYNLARKAHENGTHFPIWGTCLGLEVMAHLLHGQEVLTTCSARDMALHLNFGRDFRSSRMFSGLPKQLERALRTMPITYNAHHFCITPENFTAFGLNRFYTILSTNTDRNGLTFVSSMEAKHHPLYAVQFHPEMNNFEWAFDERHRRIPHSRQASQLAQFLANFFVDEARKNEHHFKTPAEESNALIFNYKAVFTQGHDFYTQMYFFY